MALDHTEQLLIDALKSLPPRSIYADAGKREIIRGFQLYIDQRIERIEWEPHGVLVAEVGSRPAGASEFILSSVRLFVRDKSVRSECSCGRSGHEGNCEHVISVLVTLLHHLKPSLFKMTRENPAYRARIDAGFFKHRQSTAQMERGKVLPFVSPRGLRVKASPRFEIIMEPVGCTLRAFVEMDGRRLDEGADYRAVPWEIAYLARSGYQRDMSYSLSVFLKRTDKLYPLYYQQGSRRQEVGFLGERTCPAWTELDARNDEIIVRKACSLEGEGESGWSMVGNFALNLGRAEMVRVRPKTGWQSWDLIWDLTMSDGAVAGRLKMMGASEIGIPIGDYRNLHIPLRKFRERETLGMVKFMEEGKEAAILRGETTRYRISITRDNDGQAGFVIRPECWSGAYSFEPSRQVLSFVKSVESGVVPASIRTRKRKGALYDAFFQTLAAPNRKVAGVVLKAAIDEAVFGRRHSVAEARRLVREAIDSFDAEDVQFHHTDRGWRFISMDKEKERLLFVVPFAAFGPRLFERVAPEGARMAVSETHLLERLHVLHTLASEAGVEISFDNMAVEPVTWDVEVDATEGTIDWFELRPEIRCNGGMIPRELWEQALARKGVILRNGVIQVLDEKSLRRLSAVLGLSSQGKSASGVRMITAVPRLRIIELSSLRKEGILVRLTPEDEALMARLTEFRRIEEKPLAEGLTASLRPYQREGFYWLAFLYENRFGACLADDMGLGKTVQAIALLGAIKERKVAQGSANPPSASRPFLIVVPPSLIFNWEREIERFCPSLKVYVYSGKERSAHARGYDVMLTSYGLVRRDIERLKELFFDVIVFDEAQAIKNIFADTTGSVRQLRGAFKVALTGTPVENHAGEYFSIMDLVLPGLLGEYREFQRKSREDMGSLLTMVKERTRPFMLRRTKEHILRELPPKLERDVYLELTEEQKRFYNRTVAEVRSTIEDAYRQKTGSQAKIIALTAIMKLRQICLTPRLLLSDLAGSSPKVEFLKDKLEELFSESHSALIFSQFTSFLDVVEGELRSKGFTLLRLDGSTPVRKRKEIVQAFQASAGPSAFLLSLKAGGQGLNLTRATYVFHLDPWWNPAVENQASDRSHRIGQKEKVIVTRLLMRHTVEEKMMALKARKAGLFRALMEAPERSGARAISREDFEFLLG